MSTTLPHGIIQINEGNIAWYVDITANWQLIDSKIGIYDAAIATIPAPANNGTLTINYGGTTIAMFGADDAGNVTADIPAPNDGQLTLRVNNTTIGTFTANQAAGTTVDIPVPTKTSDLVNDSDYITSDAVPPFATTGEINALASEFDTLWGA